MPTRGPAAITRESFFAAPDTASTTSATAARRASSAGSSRLIFRRSSTGDSLLTTPSWTGFHPRDPISGVAAYQRANCPIMEILISLDCPKYFLWRLHGVAFFAGSYDSSASRAIGRPLGGFDHLGSQPSQPHPASGNTPAPQPADARWLATDSTDGRRNVVDGRRQSRADSR